MKDVKTLLSEIEQLKSTDFSQLKKGQVKKIYQQISFLQTCVAYLESKPNLEYLKKEAQRLSNIVSNITSGQSNYIGKNPDRRKWRQEYFSEVGMPKLKTHLKTVKFLLA